MVPDWNMAIRSKHGFPPLDPKDRPPNVCHTFGSPNGSVCASEFACVFFFCLHVCDGIFGLQVNNWNGLQEC